MLENLIKERIRRDGPMSVAEYMELALMHPEFGYYMRKDPLGVQGDFITAPEISQIFGELIGAWLAQQWIAMGKPQAALAELGPGRGTLMSDALRATRHVPGFHAAVSVHLVEASPALKQKQWEALAGKHPDVRWHANFDEIPEKPLLLIANEFFDALPVRQFVFEEGEWRERRVGLDGKGQLQFVILGLDPRTHLIKTMGPRVKPEDDRIYERCEAGEHIATAIARRVCAQGGAALIIDYGYSGNSRGDTLQAVKAHQYHEVLAEPGTADLTAHVDFDALKQAAEAQGATVHGIVPQRAFLGTLGAGIRVAKLCENATMPQKSAMLSALERLTSVDQMGDLFKVLCITHPKHPTPEGF